MLSTATRIKLAVFAVLSVLIVAYTGIHYANLGRYVGMPGYYVVRLDLAQAGGIFPNADVTYRGVSVGRVGAVRLTATGVEADLNISDSAPPIPARLQAAVADLSAVGEQYVDLRPDATSGPYLTAGSVIPQRDTQLPLPVTSLLTSLNTLATSLPLGTLRTLLDEMATGLQGQGTDLASIIDGNHALVQALSATTGQTITLITNSKTVLATQIAESGELDSFANSARLLAKQLKATDPDLRKLIIAGPQVGAQVADLLANTNPGLATLIANLLTTSEVTLTRGQALDELLSVLPADIAAGSTVITNKGANFGMALTFFSPLPCTAGYGGTVYRNGLDTSPAPPLNTSAACTEPASEGDVRGSAHAPSGGGVPSAAQPGLAQLLGVTP
ncbi:MAG TPA: MlaD family protein [Trebonia sp.]|jgi:phospholipid/cholesterol/gamma-HCH transport system substrate-binding protein|nr:MlaD family protein [Trebonia sp.]